MGRKWKQFGFLFLFVFVAQGILWVMLEDKFLSFPECCSQPPLHPSNPALRNPGTAKAPEGRGVCGKTEELALACGSSRETVKGRRLFKITARRECKSQMRGLQDEAGEALQDEQKCFLATGMMRGLVLEGRKEEREHEGLRL